MQKISYTISEFCEAAGIGRTRAYQEISEGRLRTVKCGSRTLVAADEAHAWLDRLKSESREARDV